MVMEVDGYYTRGLITKSEVRKQKEDIWNKVIAELDNAVGIILKMTTP